MPSSDENRLSGRLLEPGILRASIKNSGRLTGSISQAERLSGRIRSSSVDGLSGTLQAPLSMTAVLTPQTSLHGQIIADRSHPVYDGAYEVTPEKDTQMLATTGKVMMDDVTVLAIPYYETTNESGGYTVVIG